MSLNKFVKNRKDDHKTTSKIFDISCKSVDTDDIFVDEKLIVTNKAKDEQIDFIYTTKGQPGSLFVNKDGNTCDFVDGITIENDGDIVCENVIVKDSEDNRVNLKEYIDDRINFVIASVGGTVNTLTDGGG